MAVKGMLEPLRSGLPTEERLVLELLKIRASVTDPGNGSNATKWAQDAVKALSVRHSIEWVSPYGDIEFSSKSLEALNWLKSELEKYANTSQP
jgi:hypothetical protein